MWLLKGPALRPRLARNAPAAAGGEVHLGALGGDAQGEGERGRQGDREMGRRGADSLLVFCSLCSPVIGKGIGEMSKAIRSHRDLDVYKMAFETATRIFELTKGFPKEEMYSLVDQIRRSSRSVCANLAEAWRRRRYEAAFVSKLNDAEAEAAETQVWLEFAVKCQYLDATVGRELYTTYDNILGKIVKMILHPEQWTIKQ